MCLLKELGGLHFRDLEGFNQVLLAKQVWRMLTSPNLLVSKVIQGKYFPSSSLLDADLGKRPSYFWRSLLWVCDLLINGVRKRVGNERSISVFKDR